MNENSMYIEYVSGDVNVMQKIQEVDRNKQNFLLYIHYSTERILSFGQNMKQFDFYKTSNSSSISQN